LLDLSSSKLHSDQIFIVNAKPTTATLKDFLTGAVSPWLHVPSATRANQSSGLTFGVRDAVPSITIFPVHGDMITLIRSVQIRDGPSNNISSMLVDEARHFHE
jgi:hypothetical protein